MENKKNSGLQRRAYSATRSIIRLLKPREDKKQKVPRQGLGSGLKVAFVHGERKLSTGAHHINQLMTEALAAQGVKIHNFYPRVRLTDTPAHLRGIANILFFHSLLDRKEEILKNDIVQGTTYTTLPFLTFPNVLTVSHFGSTTRGFLHSVPTTTKLPAKAKKFYKELYKLDIVPELDFKTFRPLTDTADMEEIVATRVDACIATSKKVQVELVKAGVATERVHIIHNAIENYWFTQTSVPVSSTPRPPHLVFLGRMGGDIFTLKLKGVDRLVEFYRAFPEVNKTTICMTTNRKLKEWLKVSFPLHSMYVNLRKNLIPGALAPLYGSILFLPSRYEGFSLSIIEGMSQGLVPVAYPVGVVEEVIQDGVNGFIVTSLEQAVDRASELLRNQELRLTMASKAKETAAQFTSAQIAKDLITLYRKIKANRRLISNGSYTDGNIYPPTL